MITIIKIMKRKGKIMVMIIVVAVAVTTSIDDDEDDAILHTVNIKPGTIHNKFASLLLFCIDVACQQHRGSLFRVYLPV